MPTRRTILVVHVVILSLAVAMPSHADLTLNQLLLPPRSLAMGGAATATSNDLEVSVGNPAGLSQLGSTGFAAAAAVSGDVDFWGVGAFGVQSGDQERQFAFTVLDMEDELTGAESTIASATIAHNSNDRLSAGVTVKWVANNPSVGASDDFFTLDLGLQYRVSPESDRSGVLGLAVSNLFDESAPGVDPGVQLAIGAQGELSDKVLVTADVADLFNSGPAGAVFRAGLEVELTDRVLLRAGVNDGDSSLGAGFVTGEVRIDVGWRNDTDLRDDIVTVGATSSF